MTLSESHKQRENTHKAACSPSEMLCSNVPPPVRRPASGSAGFFFATRPMSWPEQDDRQERIRDTPERDMAERQGQDDEIHPRGTPTGCRSVSFAMDIASASSPPEAPPIRTPSPDADADEQRTDERREQRKVRNARPERREMLKQPIERPRSCRAATADMIDEALTAYCPPAEGVAGGAEPPATRAPVKCRTNGAAAGSGRGCRPR